MKKIFVLDTNVLLHDVGSLFAFQDNDVIIPIVAIEELDRFKKDLNEIGRNARQVSRTLDGLRSEGPLYKGIKLDNGGTIRVYIPSEKADNLPEELIFCKADNQILSVALELKDENVVLVTKDTNLRIKADALGITARDYETDKVEFSELYEGITRITVSKDQIDSFYEKGSMELSTAVSYPNEGFILKDETNEKHAALARRDPKSDALLPLKLGIDAVWSILPRNAEQRFALDLLLDDSIKLVSLAGKAGTGKTLMALAAGLQKSIDEGIYTRMLVSRPIFPMGKDIGYLPGDIKEKLTPWMQPIFDNLELIFGTPGKHKDKREGKHRYKELMDQGMLEIEPLTYIRGRSIPKQYLLIDEVQNLTPHEIKTIITRAGDETKIVITGDPYQIDNPYLDSSSNGLSYAADRLKSQRIHGHMTLEKSERSELAAIAAELL